MKALCYFSTIIAIIVSLWHWKDVDAGSVKIVGTIAYIFLVALLCHIVSIIIKEQIKEKLHTADNKIKKYASYIIFIIGCVVYCSITYLSYLFYQYYHIESYFVRKSYPYIIASLGIFAFCVISRFSKE
jgi:magnesium-transporting ATPase (P-type)